MIADVCAGVAFLLEPAGQAEIDPAGAEPYTWVAGILYVYPTRQRFTPIESGPTARQDFELLAIYVADGDGEEAKRSRSSELTTELDARGDRYTTAVRRSQRTELWDHLAANLDAPAPATLSTRALAVRLSGYRIVT